MPRSLLRPSTAGITEIETILFEENLSPKARRRLLAVRAWAKGKTTNEVALEPSLKMSRYVVLSAVHQYLDSGPKSFVTYKPGAAGRKPVPPEKAAKIAEMLRLAFEAGSDLPYRKIKAETGVSLGKISKIARAAGLDMKNRRAGSTVTTSGKKTVR